jgi:ABC-2 type transport system ATP-binding protein
MGVLVLDHVVKRFGEFTAVNDLSFDVPEGAIFGFLGGNGAGKTTSLRMVLDILRPTSGRIEVLGRAPGRENAALLGFLPEERGLYARMTVLETIVYFAQLKGMTASVLETGRAAASRSCRKACSRKCRSPQRW